MLLNEYIPKNDSQVIYMNAVQASLLIPKHKSWNHEYQKTILPLLGLTTVDFVPEIDGEDFIEAPEAMSGQLDAWDRMWIMPLHALTYVNQIKLFCWDSETLANYSKGKLFSAAGSTYEARVNILNNLMPFLREHRPYMFDDNSKVTEEHKPEYDEFILSIFKDLSDEVPETHHSKTAFLVGVE